MKSKMIRRSIFFSLNFIFWIFHLSSSKILLKNKSEYINKQIKEGYPENILARSESRKLLVNLWNKDPHSKTTHIQRQKLDFFGTTSDHIGKIVFNNFGLYLKILVIERTWNKNCGR